MNHPMGPATRKFLDKTESQSIYLFFQEAANLSMGGTPLTVESYTTLWEIVIMVKNLSPTEEKCLLLVLALSLVHTMEGSTRLHLEKNGSGSLGEMAATYLLSRANSSPIMDPQTVVETFISLLRSGKLDSICLRCDSLPDYEPIKGELVEIKPFIVVNNWFHHQNSVFNEMQLAKRIKPLLRETTSLISKIEMDDSIFSFYLPSGQATTLNQEQVTAVKRAVNRRFSIISGGPGTGKTSVITTILKAFSLKYPKGEIFALAAPTGKAAYRMTRSIKENISHSPTQKSEFELVLLERTSGITLHRLLGYSPSNELFLYNEENPLPHKVIIIDEASMIDTALMNRIFSALGRESHLVLIGDPHQLPSIGCGAVLKDLVSLDKQETKTASAGELIKGSVTSLKVNHRSNNSIIECAEMINSENISSEQLSQVVESLEPTNISPKEGAFFIPLTHDVTLNNFLEGWYEMTTPFGENNSDLEFLIKKEPNINTLKQSETVDYLFSKLDNSKLLCVTNHLKTGAISINRWFHEKRVGLSEESGPFLSYEPVMIIKNDYKRDLFNGDQGLIVNVIEGTEPPKKMVIFMKEGLYKTFHLDTISKNLTLSYGISIHKSQGSEYGNIGIILPETKLPLLTKELLYTGVTRAKKSLYFTGNLNILNYGIKNKSDRDTTLKSLLAF